MNDERRADVPDWVHELADDRVDEPRRAALLASLAGDPAARARFDDYRALNRRLRDAYGPLADAAVPTALRRAARPRPLSARLSRVAASLLALLLAAGAGWLARDLQPDRAASAPGIDEVVTRAVDAHLVYLPEVRHPVEVVAAERQHLVAWLSKRLGSRLDAPDLRGQGFDLVGGRLLPGGGKPAAQFMYEDAGGRRVTVYLRVAVEGSAPSALRYAALDATGVVYWVDPPVAVALSGNLPREELEPLARQVHGQRNP